jgi:hypothetical protein
VRFGIFRIASGAGCQADPQRSYQSYCDWCDSEYEAGTVAIKPSQVQYSFLTSGVTITGAGLDLGADSGIGAYWSWVFDQQPASGTMPTKAKVNVIIKRTGYAPPPELRHLWGL